MIHGLGAMVPIIQITDMYCHFLCLIDMATVHDVIVRIMDIVVEIVGIMAAGIIEMTAALVIGVFDVIAAVTVVEFVIVMVIDVFGGIGIHVPMETEVILDIIPTDHVAGVMI